MNLKQKVLMSVGTLGVAAAVAAGGSFATFDAQTTNPGNTFATGTLVMSNTVNTGTACLSTGGGSTDTNVNNGCGTLFNLTVKKPGDSATANLTITNAGSLDATALKSFATGCVNADAAETYHGTGTPCSAVQLYIQQTDSSFSAKTACLYGGAAVTNTCDFSDTNATIGAYATAHSNSGNGLSIGSGLTHGTSDYFVVGVKLPDTADNSYQGRQATVGLSWFMQ